MSTPQSYVVRPGDTLNGIAAKFSKSPAEIAKINNLADKDRITVGQVLFLEESHAFSIQIMFMDALRYPIQHLEYALKFDGKTVGGKTNVDGLAQMISTASAKSLVEIFVKRKDGSWKKAGEQSSGLGKQWLRFISDSLQLPEKAAPHDTEQAKPSYLPQNTHQEPPKTKSNGTPIAPGHAVKKKKGKGHNTTVIELDYPNKLIEYFEHYTGVQLTEKEWETTAKKLSCESKVLKAIARVESPDGGFIPLKGGKHMPRILYERHIFSRLTAHQYDKTDSDISWPYAFVSSDQHGKKNKHMPTEKVEATDVYGRRSYLRLLKAYKLAPDAALRACSWGKFQILGDNWEENKYVNLDDLMITMCTSEVTQLEALRRFIEHKPKRKKKKSLKEAVQDKNWELIALYYNGSGQVTKYSNRLKDAYDHL